jgi:ankyrin repeat protein
MVVGVDVKSKNDVGQTPLSHAVGGEHKTAVKLLLAKKILSRKTDNQEANTVLRSQIVHKISLTPTLLGALRHEATRE